MKKLLFLSILVPLFFSCKEEKITSIEMSETSCEIASGESHVLKFTYSPANLDRPIVQWSSSNPQIAEVEGSNNTYSCRIHGKQVGSASITCTELSTGNRLSAKCYVNVYSKAKFNTELISVEKGQSLDLSEYISDVNGYINWRSNDENICTIDGNTLYARNIGKCTITGHISESNSDISCVVEVTSYKPTQIECQTDMSLFWDVDDENNNYYSIDYSFLPEDAEAEVTLTSANPEIAEVVNGTTFIVKQPGSTNLTISTDNGLSQDIYVNVSGDITEFVQGEVGLYGQVNINGVTISGREYISLANHSKCKVYAVEYTLKYGSSVVAHEYYNYARPIIGIGQPNGEKYEFTNISLQYPNRSSCSGIITYEYNNQQYTINCQ